MSELIEIQSITRSHWDQSKFCSFSHEVIDCPTAPLIHQEARFLFINRGSGTLLIQNRPYHIQPNMLISLLPWQISQVTEVTETWQYYLIIYNQESVRRIARITKIFYDSDDGTPTPWISHMEEHPVRLCSGNQLPQLSRIFEMLRNEIGLETSCHPGSPLPMHNTLIINYLVEIIVFFERMLLADGSARPVAIDPSDILRYMYIHCREKLTLKMLSQLFYYSESSISSYLTRVTGLSFFDLLNEIRVGQIANFLLYTDLTLEELADLLGYVDISHISKVFAARSGSKIKEYQKTYQKVENICMIEESQLSCRIITYVYRNYCKDLTAGEVARMFGLNVTKLNYLFLCQTERNFSEFLSRLRINRACDLLLHTSKTVDDIAAEVGYNSVKTFNRHFLKQRNLQPSAFRRKMLSSGAASAAPAQKHGGGNT